MSMSMAGGKDEPAGRGQSTFWTEIFALAVQSGIPEMELSGICGIAVVFETNERKKELLQKGSKEAKERGTLDNAGSLIPKIDRCRSVAIIAGLVSGRMRISLDRTE